MLPGKGGLGRKVPQDWEHLKKYPFRSLAPTAVAKVNSVLSLPYWHWTHDQGSEGACEGFGNSMMMSILNEDQRRAAKLPPPYSRRYDPWWLWDEAKLVDGFSDTNPGDHNGTTGRAACDVLRTKGHVKSTNNERVKNPTPDLESGIIANRWAQSIDDMRTAISMRLPMAIGINWYEAFDGPNLIEKSNGWYAGLSSRGWRIRGGHCICVYGASDFYQAFKLKNSWGRSYPLVWMPYNIMERLIRENGEVAIVTDR